ncbi:lipoprotein [Porphyromonas loveana]|uniref:lipoprotein n=2 Tax=Porphyromonas loveana TaxID=1884669 RepID=UPI0035A055AA
MKKVLLFTVAAIVLSGCKIWVNPYNITAGIELESVLVDGEQAEGVHDAEEMTFRDETLSIDWGQGLQQFDFELHNKTAGTIRINWEKSTYVDITGEAKRIIHKGVKFVDMNKAIPSSNIAPRTKLTDIVLPTDYVEYSYGWIQKNILSYNFANTNVAMEQWCLVKGKKIQIILAIEDKQATREYAFTFVINKRVFRDLRAQKILDLKDGC